MKNEPDRGVNGKRTQIVLEGEVDLTGFVCEPGATSEMLSLSFTPGKKFLEDMVHARRGI